MLKIADRSQVTITGFKQLSTTTIETGNKTKDKKETKTDKSHSSKEIEIVGEPHQVGECDEKFDAIIERVYSRSNSSVCASNTSQTPTQDLSCANTKVSITKSFTQRV